MNVCGCSIDAASPGPCPYCHHREHGVTGCRETLASTTEVEDLKKRLRVLEIFVKNHMHYVGSAGRMDRHSHHMTNRPNGAERL